MHKFTVRDLQSALYIAKKRIAKEKEAKETQQSGFNYIQNNNPHKAIDCYLKLLEIAQELGYKGWVGVAHSNLGNAYYRIGQYQMAIQCHKKSLEIAEELDHQAELGAAHGNLGNSYNCIGQCQMAIKCHKKYLEISKELGDQAGVGTAYGNLGSAYNRIGQYKIAIECHKKQLEIAEERGDQAGVGKAHGGLGSAYHSIGQHKMAIECHKKHLEIAEEQGDQAEVGKAHGDLGNAYHSIGQYQMAIEYLKKDLEIAEELGNREKVATVYGNFGNTYHSIGQYQMAMECYKKCLEIAEEVCDQKQEGGAHGGLGDVYQSTGQYQMAIDCHKKHLDIAEELGDLAGVRKAHRCLGIVYVSIGQYQMAIECHKKELEISKELGHQAGVGLAYGNLGNAYESIGQYQMAIHCHKKMLKISEELGDQIRVGTAHGNLGNVYNSIGQYQMAMECHKKHLEIAEELGDKAGVGKAHGNLGNTYHIIGQHLMAIEYNKKYLDIAEELGDQAGVGIAHGNLGNAYKSIGQHQMAIECHKKDLQIAEGLGDISGTVRAHACLGIVYEGYSNDRACRHFAKSILDSHNIRRNSRFQDKFNTSMLNIFADLHRFLLRSLLNLNQIKAALLVSDDGKASALSDLIRKYVDGVADFSLGEQQTRLFHEIADDPCSKSMEMFFDNAHSQIMPFKEDGSIIFYSFDSRHDLNVWVMSRDGVFHVQWQTSNGSSMLVYLNQLVKAVRESLWRSVREYSILYPENYGCHDKFERKVDEYLNIKPPKEEQRSFVRDLEKRIRNIFTNSRPNHGLDYGRGPSGEESVRERYHLEGPMQRHGRSCYSMGNIKESDDAEWKLCEYYSLDMPGTNHSSRSRSRKSGTKSLNSYTDTDVYLEKLYSKLIAPIKEHLTGSKLLIVPDRLLFLLPFCALLNKKEGHLCDQYSLQITPALQVLNASLLKPFSKLGPALFIGNPTVGEVKFLGQLITPQALPKARDEARKCAKYFGGVPLLEEKATKVRVLENMEDASIIHIAAHGHMDRADIFLAPNAGAPKPPSEKHYLLTTADVLKCHLKARLVVLSCCNSGRGEISNEGVVGIARSFLGAGARSVLVSLWPIPDEETMEFMKQFYNKVCQGVSVCSALQKTMIEFKKKVSVSAWAPFQIVGEDIVLSEKEIEEIRRQSSMSRTSEENASKPNDVHFGSDV